MVIEHYGSFPLLTLVTLLPLVGAVVLGLVPKAQPVLIRAVALLVTSLTFLFSLRIWAGFDDTLAGMQMVDSFAWIDTLGARFVLGVDGISLLLVMLTTFLSPLVVLGSFKTIEHKEREFYISYLVLESGMLGALTALDLLAFYLFWEFMLIPMYLIIGVWGGKERVYATVKFFIYTMVGSLLMLVAIIYLYIEAGATTFALADILTLELNHSQQLWLFAAFGLAFAIKVPLFPFHTWLPDAHVQAPTPGSVILAGVLLKLGTYGMIRFAIPLFPDAAGSLAIPIISLSIVGIVYGALVAYAQQDVKKLVAYSSVSHLGFVMLGLMVLSQEAVEGSILQMVNHGISTGALFLLVGMIYERRHTRMIEDFGGLAKILPVFTTMFLIVTMSSIGLPGTNGFVGEFLILVGTFSEGLGSAIVVAPEAGPTQQFVAMLTYIVILMATLGLAYVAYRDIEHRVGRVVVSASLAVVAVLVLFVWRETLYLLLQQGINSLRSWRNFLVFMGIVATTGVILGAVYMLSMFRRVMFGPVRHVKNQGLKDLSGREWAVMVPLVVLIFVIGFFPNIFLSKTRASVSAFIESNYVEVTARRAPESLERAKIAKQQMDEIANTTQKTGVTR